MDLNSLVGWAAVLDNWIVPIITAMVGSFGGAVGGAWAAQKIAARVRESDRIQDEIRRVKPAQEILFGICNVLFNMKEQHVLEMKRAYDEQRAIVQEHNRKLQAEELPAGTQLEIGMDLRTLDVIRVRADKLEALIVDGLSVQGRAVPMFNILVQSIGSLNNLIASRNELIERMKPLPQDAKVRLMFGLPLREGMVDDTFGHYVSGIASLTDDCLYFAMTLADELHKYGSELRDLCRRKYRREMPSIPKLRFNIAEEKGLVPSKENYHSWETLFLRKVSKTRRRYLAKGWYFLRFRWRKFIRKCHLHWTVIKVRLRSISSVCP